MLCVLYWSSIEEALGTKVRHAWSEESHMWKGIASCKCTNNTCLLKFSGWQYCVRKCNKTWCICMPIIWLLLLHTVVVLQIKLIVASDHTGRSLSNYWRVASFYTLHRPVSSLSKVVVHCKHPVSAAIHYKWLASMQKFGFGSIRLGSIMFGCIWLNAPHAWCMYIYGWSCMIRFN